MKQVISLFLIIQYGYICYSFTFNNYKIKQLTNSVKTLHDTILTYKIHQYDQIPVALQPFCKGAINSTEKKQSYTTIGYLYNKDIYVHIPNNNAKVTKPTPDNCPYNLISITTNKKCGTNGGITGQGCGACSGLFQKKYKKINITIIITIY